MTDFYYLFITSVLISATFIALSMIIDNEEEKIEKTKEMIKKGCYDDEILYELRYKRTQNEIYRCLFGFVATFGILFGFKQLFKKSSNEIYFIKEPPF